MHLSWNELRARAEVFARKWKDASDENRDTQTFYNEFFQIFDVKRESVARYEVKVRKLDDTRGRIDLLWPGLLLVEQKSAGRNLESAYEQAGEYFDGLTEKERPEYILVSDFRTFRLSRLATEEVAEFRLSDLKDHIDKFSFLLGRERRTFRDQHPINVAAAELVGRLHDALETSGYTGHDLERFLVRLVFCLFADDTGIFEPRDLLIGFIENRTREDGADLGPLLSQLFEVLDTPEDRRLENLDEDLAKFPHVNGALFCGPLRIPSFDSAMRRILLDACSFDWAAISPAIFGALFQSVMDPAERRAQGAHYTTEKNILKVVEPLFLDDLRAEFDRLRARKDGRRAFELRRFQKKLGELTFFDPACGCGNFLVIAYRELRLLELAVLKELYAGRRQLEVLVDRMSVLDVDQFYGIEIGEFPVRIAETALWMMDHIMNNQLSLEFGQTYTRIPLAKSPNIVHGDALEMDWAEVLPQGECDFVFGNPPFVGKSQQSPEQAAQVRRVAELGKQGGTLDYVAAWFIKAGAYVSQAGKPVRIGLVATNSVTQGEQVGLLWPVLFDRYDLDLAVAHRTFAWGSDARGKAHVHVVIVGLDRRQDARPVKRLFSYADVNGEPDEQRCRALSPYLFDGSRMGDPHLTVQKVSRPINGLRRLKTGVQMIDNGLLTFTGDEREEFLAHEPGAAKFFRRYIGGDEYINGFHRWILYLAEASPAELRRLPRVAERVAAVRRYRASRSRESTVRMASFPTRVGVDHRLAEPFLVLPNTSSERRDYIPIGWLTPEVVANQKLRILPKATLAEFALLTSAMHMAWMRTVTGRMKSDYMYSVGVVYNTFPTPAGVSEPGESGMSRLSPLAQAVLDARSEHPDATLADLYDPDLMPATLRRAHQSLDRAVERLYRPERFKSENDRIEHLFGLYERMQAPLVTEAVKQGRRRRRRPTTQR